MPSLKDLRVRIRSVKSTQKITAAMKTVAAAKLRRAQEQAQASRPYAQHMSRMVSQLAQASQDTQGAIPLLSGTGKSDVHLVIVATADRGLCGGFNSSIVRDARQLIQKLLADGKQVKIVCMGRKGRDQLKRDFATHIIHTFEFVGRKRIGYGDAEKVSDFIQDLFAQHQFDVCTMVYARFKSAISQLVTRQQLIPAPFDQAANQNVAVDSSQFLFEPEGAEILERLLPKNLSVQIFSAMLENAASEQGARMSAMDNATRNAGQMIQRLSLHYNRTRQAHITRELIEIISGAEAI